MDHEWVYGGFFNLFESYNYPVIVYAVGQAFEKNPAIAQAFTKNGHEVASHAYR